MAPAQVALKRIPDVLSSPEQAKRVLREVCILRRLHHPNLINLRDAFTRPASSGAPHQVKVQGTDITTWARLVSPCLSGKAPGSIAPLTHQLVAVYASQRRILLWKSSAEAMQG